MKPETIAGGYALVARKIDQWELYREPNCAHVFQHLIRLATYQDRKSMVRGVECNLARGQCWTTLTSMAQQTGLTKKQVRTVFKKLAKTGTVIIDERAHRFSVVTLCNYKLYQDPSSYNGHSGCATVGTPEGTVRAQSASGGE